MGSLPSSLCNPTATVPCSRGMPSARCSRSGSTALRAGQSTRPDDEAAEIPACPACGVPDTWESRQGAAFGALVAEIDACSSVGGLGLVGKRLYGLALPHEQASVAWSHWQLRRAALEAAVTLGAEARGLLAEVER